MDIFIAGGSGLTCHTLTCNQLLAGGISVGPFELGILFISR